MHMAGTEHCAHSEQLFVPAGARAEALAPAGTVTTTARSTAADADALEMSASS